MRVQQFIEKAIEGGWNTHNKQTTVALEDGAKVYLNNENDDRSFIPLPEILIDPEAWKAVGKVEGWDRYPNLNEDFIDGWQYNMHRMIDALAEGKSIEQFLETL